MSDLSSKEKLPDWLRRWYCLKGEPRFREAADEIERLQGELDAAEQHVKILRENAASHEPPALETYRNTIPVRPGEEPRWEHPAPPPAESRWDVNYQPALVFAVRELLGSLPKSRDWFNPDAERVFREYISDARQRLDVTAVTKSPTTGKDGSAAVHEAASGGEVPPERTLMPDLAEAIKSGVPLVQQLRAGHETSKAPWPTCPDCQNPIYFDHRCPVKAKSEEQNHGR